MQTFHFPLFACSRQMASFDEVSGSFRVNLLFTFAAFMKDIETREDLETLLREFYKSAIQDAQIGHHFDDLDLDAHLPVIVNFWEKVLFGKTVYFGNPLAVHQILHAKSPLELEHFQRWFEIFSRTTDKFFIGETAENAKLRAKMIAHSLNQNLDRAA